MKRPFTQRKTATPKPLRIPEMAALHRKRPVVLTRPERKCNA